MNIDKKSLKAALDRAEELASMLKQIVNHADEPAMSDSLFREFARENAQWILDNTEVENT